MNRKQQILHILKKDIRAHWSELATLALVNTLLVITCSEPWSLSADRGLSLPALATQLQTLISVLLMIAWSLLIARVVHGEAPASRSQFWLTRPYSRASLLAAKAVFILLFAHVLTGAAQVLILAISGLPFAFGDFVLNQLVLLALVTLPAMTIAALTRSQARFALIATAVAGIGLATMFSTGFIADEVYRGYGLAGLPSVEDFLPVRNFLRTILALPAITIIATVTLVYQYRSRQTRKALSFCAAGIVLAVLVIGALPDALASRAYSRLIGTPADRITVSLNPDVEVQGPVGGVYTADNNGEVEVFVPIDLSYDTIVRIAVVGLEAAVTSSEGTIYRARNGFETRDIGLGFRRSGTRESLQSFFYFRMPRERFEGVADDAVTIEFRFDLKEYAYFPANPIPSRNAFAQIDDREQCGIGDYASICRYAFGSSAGVGLRPVSKHRNAAALDRQYAEIVSIRQAAAVPFRINPIVTHARNSYTKYSFPISVMIAAPRSYESVRLELANTRLRDWVVASGDD